ncbi:MAG: cyclodeaminase/cyclohydrolase family protein, partial [Anaerolineae bacterium]
ARADAIRTDLTAAIDADSAAFEGVMAAMKLPKDTPEQQETRRREIQVATQRAIDVPLSVARACVEVLELAQGVAERGNVNALSDAAAAAHMARTAIEAAGMNVRVNAVGLDDRKQAGRQIEELKELRERAATLADQILGEVERRATLA